MPMFKSKYYLPLDITDKVKELESGIKTFRYEKDFEVYDGGIILPLVRYPETKLQGKFINVGGVCDRNLNFVAGYEKGDHLLDYTSAYIPKEIQHSDETVIFSGDLHRHFGHFIQDSISRLWYAVKYREQDFKIAILINPNWPNWDFNPEGSYHINFINLLGIRRERVLIVDKPTQFKQVIVPKQCVFWGEGYDKDLMGIVYNAARKTVTPKNEKKIYLSKSKFEKQDIYNEEYFERFFVDQGFKVINPEQLPLEEQIAFVSGADEIACTYGTLSHWSLFAQDGIKLINILRYPYALDNRQLFIDSLKKLDSVYIDATLNLFPVSNVGCPYLIGPSVYWQHFLQLEYQIDSNDGLFDYLDNSRIKFGDYIRNYLDRVSGNISYMLIFGYNFDHASFLKSLYMSFDPIGYAKLRSGMISTDNPLFKERLFRLKKGNSQSSPIIKLLSDGRIYPLDGKDMEEKYWSADSGRLYLMNNNYTPISEFTIPVSAITNHKPKQYKGVLRTDVSVTCYFYTVRQSHRFRNYIIRHLIIEPLVGKKPYKKLKQNPDRFFGDSKNNFIRFLGRYYVRNYNTVVFDYREAFRECLKSGDLSSRISTLKQGLDDISCAYIDHFISLSRYWYRTDYAGSMWTDHDHLKRRECIEFEKGFEQPFPEILEVDPYFFAHNYCLDDLPDEALEGIEGSTIIDGGGYNGDTALAFHSHFPNAEIHVFEPLSFYVRTIESFLEVDSCNNKISVINKGLGDSTGTSRISYEVAEQEAEITTIDEAYASQSGRIGLIKLDTTGSELGIIKGAANTIRKHRPVIAAAMYYKPESFFGLRDGIREIIPDYRFMIRRSCLRGPQTGLMLIAY